MIIEKEKAIQMADHLSLLTKTKTRIINKEEKIISYSDYCTSKLSNSHYSSTLLATSHRAKANNLTEPVSHVVSTPITFHDQTIGRIEFIHEYTAAPTGSCAEKKILDNIVNSILEATCANPVDQSDTIELFTDKGSYTAAIILSANTLIENEEKESCERKRLIDFGRIERVLQNIAPQATVIREYPHHLILLNKTSIKEKENRDKEDCYSVKNLAKKILDSLKKMGYSDIRIGCGHHYCGPDSIKNAYLSAMQSLKIGKTLYPDKRLYSHTDMPLELLISSCDDWSKEKLKSFYRTLINKDKHGHLQKSLHHLFSENLNIGRAAAKLHVHPNTLRYRIDKIKKITGMDVKNLDQAILLYAASKTHKTTKTNPHKNIKNNDS